MNNVSAGLAASWLSPSITRAARVLFTCAVFALPAAAQTTTPDPHVALLTELQNNSIAGISGIQAIKNLTDFDLPASGTTLTDPQTAFMNTLLYDAQMHTTEAIDNPAQFTKDLISGDNYLIALRNTTVGGVPALQSLQTLTGQSLPPSGPLILPEIQFLFTQLFKSDSTPQKFLTDFEAKGDVSILNAAAQGVVHADAYLAILRQTVNGVLAAGVAALKDLTGTDLGTSGPLSTESPGPGQPSQIDLLFYQLFKKDPNDPTKTLITLAYSQPATANTAVIVGDAFLGALRSTLNALTSLADLTGHVLPKSGFLSTVSPGSGQLSEVETFFTLIFNNDQTLQDFVTQYAAKQDPSILTQAAQNLNLADNYWKALQQAGAIDALKDLSGKDLAPDSNGHLSGDAQVADLISLLYKKDPKTGLAVPQEFISQGDCNQVGAACVADAKNLVTGDNYWKALKSNSNKVGDLVPLDALQELTGYDLHPDGSGHLTSNTEDQIGELISLLYKSPKDGGGLQEFVISFEKTGDTSLLDKTAKLLPVGDRYLQAINRDANQVGDLTPLKALQDLTGFDLSLQTDPKTGKLNTHLTGDQLTTLFGLFYKTDGVTLQQFVTDFEGNQDLSILDNAAKDLVYGEDFFLAMGNNANKEAGINPLDALQALTGFDLHPDANGHLTSMTEDQIGELIGLLYKSPKEGGGRQDFVTNGQFDQAAQNLAYGDRFWMALKNSTGNTEAGINPLDALFDLTGFDLHPDANGHLTSMTEDQIGELIGLLYSAKKDRHGRPMFQDFVKTGNFAGAVRNLIYADDYLKVLANTPGALQAIYDLIHVDLRPKDSNKYFNASQIQALIGFLYKPDGSYQDFVMNGDFDKAAKDWIAADNLKNAYQNTPGAIDALYQLTGVELPTSGPLVNKKPHGNIKPNADEIQAIYNQIYDASGNHTMVFDDCIQSKQAACTQNAQNLVEAVAPASGPSGNATIGVLLGIGAAVVAAAAAWWYGLFDDLSLSGVKDYLANMGWRGWTGIGIGVIALILLALYLAGVFKGKKKAQAFDPKADPPPLPQPLLKKVLGPSAIAIGVGAASLGIGIHYALQNSQPVPLTNPQLAGLQQAAGAASPSDLIGRAFIYPGEPPLGEPRQKSGGNGKSGDASSSAKVFYVTPDENEKSGYGLNVVSPGSRMALVSLLSPGLQYTHFFFKKKPDGPIVYTPRAKRGLYAQQSLLAAAGFSGLPPAGRYPVLQQAAFQDKAAIILPDPPGK